MFKYASDIQVLNDCKIQCPPEDVHSMDGDLYRFVHLPECVGFYNNNKPVLKINPTRTLWDDSKRCVAVASLSCYESQRDILAQFEKLKKTHKSIAKSIGCQIARFTVSKDDGLRTDSGDDGHFSFFESESCDLNSKCVIIQEISTICRE